MGPKSGEAGPHLINFKTENKQDDTGRTELESLGWPMPSHLFGLYSIYKFEIWPKFHFFVGVLKIVFTLAILSKIVSGLPEMK